MAEIIGLALAGPPAVEGIVKTVKTIRDLLQRYQDGDAAMKTYQLQIDTHLIDIENIARFISESLDGVDDFSRNCFQRLLLQLQSLLSDFQSAASTQMDRQGNLRRIKFAFRGHNALKKLDLELGDWRRRVGDAIFSLCLVRGRSFPDLLRQPRPAALESLAAILEACLEQSKSSKRLQLDDGDRASDEGVTIRYSRAKFHTSPSHCLSEIHQGPASPEAIRDIASVLAASDPEYVALLRCQGFYGNTLQYLIPAGLSNLRTLREALLAENPQWMIGAQPSHSLDERLLLMKKLASTVLYIHLARHVHKGVRPDNVLLLKSDQQAATSFGSPFLIGFDLTRKDVASSSKRATTETNKYYYLPPDRQGDPTRKFSMLDDIYALGVVFLELALCLSFVRPKGHSANGETVWERHPILLESASGGQENSSVLTGVKLRQRLISQARKSVPRTMGSTIAGLIVSCLSCLHDEEAFGDASEMEDEDGIVLGVTFAKRVIAVLDQVML